MDLLETAKRIKAAKYPDPEVFEKKTPTSATDIYMAAKCAVALVGGDVETNKMPDSVPVEVQQFLTKCLHRTPAKRPQDAWGLIGEFSALLERLVGKRTFRDLILPKRTCHTI